MARVPRLNRTRSSLLALLAVVILLHALALQWLGRALDAAPRLHALATPMFTRLLQPDAAVAPPPSAAARVPSPPSGRVAVASIRAPRAPVPARAASAAARRAAAARAAAARAVAAKHRTPTLPDAPETVVARAPEPTSAASETAPASDAPPAPSAAPTSEAASAAQSPESAAPASAPTAPESTASAPAPAASAASAPASMATAPASAASSPAPALDTWPSDTRLSYRMGGYIRGEIYGSARVQWQRQSNIYQTRIEISLMLLSVTLTSQGEVTAKGLAPKAYEESQPNRVRGVRLGADTVVLNDGSSVPRPPGVQDTASQFVELSHRFATGQETLEVGRSVKLWLARPGGLDLWTYDIVEREVLQTAGLGPVEAFHLRPRPLQEARGNITAEMWFAPSLQYLPVRILVKMGDEAYLDLMVQKIEQR